MNFNLLNLDDNKFFEMTCTRSPINIEVRKTLKTKDNFGINLNYSDETLIFFDNFNHIVLISNGKALINGRNFYLKGVHFHCLSEHTIDGDHYPMEAHFVHISEIGEINVIAVFFKEGKKNNILNEIINQDLKKESYIKIDLDLQNLFPKNKSYFSYMGSLTGEPFLENIQWYVLKNPIEASIEQLNYFKENFVHKNLKIFPLGNRTVVNYSELN